MAKHLTSIAYHANEAAEININAKETNTLFVA